MIADDHRILLDGLSGLLQSEEGFSIEGLAGDGYEVLDLVQKNDYDVCLLDINMPKMDGLEAAKLLREKKPDLKIIILTTYDDKEIIAELVDIGVSGYLLKNAGREELVDAIRKVHAGRYYFSAGAEKIILEDLSKRKKEKPVRLTAREEEVFQLLLKEYSNDKIAGELNISYRTVETHRKNIMQKTNTHSLAGLMKFAYSKGFVK